MADDSGTTEEGGTGPRTPPKGTVPMMISMREMETYELKNGPGIQDTVTHKVFEKSWIMDQVQAMGFMCPFHGFRKQITEQCKHESLLVVADKEEVYGENWLLVLSKEAFDAQMQIIESQNSAAEAEAAAAEAEAEQDAVDPYENLVYEDKPIIPASTYESETRDATHAEIAATKITPELRTEPIKLMITKAVKHFKGSYKFSDRDSDHGFVECRQHKDPNYDLTRKTCEIGLQKTSTSPSDSGTQTAWFRSVNSALQYKPIGLSTTSKQECLESPALLNFLKSAVVVMEEALQQNETLDIFVDELTQISEMLQDAAGEGSSADLGKGTTAGSIREVRTFADLEFSKNKTLSCIDWHPTKKGVVAVSAVSNQSFDDRARHDDVLLPSHILLWNFNDLIHPEMMARSPQDIYVFKFNPTQPNIVVAGGYSGQVLMWDSADEASFVKRNKKTKSSVPVIEPVSISHIDASHRRPVSDLHWLPPGVSVNQKGHLTTSGDNIVSYQFMTVAGDGQVMFWDTRYREYPSIYGSASYSHHKQDSNSVDISLTWTPIFSLIINKTEGIGEYGLCKVVPASSDFKTTKFYSTTEEGMLLQIDWNGQENVIWNALDHHRPGNTLLQSPYYSDILLSVGDCEFHLWRNVGSDLENASRVLLFHSPETKDCAMTSGAWSPSRPSVILIGKSDGSLDIWDLLDQSFRPSVTTSISPSIAITSLVFYNPKLLAAGDANGNLHILKLPRNVTNALNNEVGIFKSVFLEPEVARVAYIERQQKIFEELNPATDNGEDGGGNDAMDNNNQEEGAMTTTTTTAEEEESIKLREEYAKLEAEFLQ